MAGEKRSDRYGILVYNDQPVADQYRTGDDICVVFCNGTTTYVAPTDWDKDKKFVFVPKSCGTREQIVKNWGSYRKYCSSVN